MLITGRDKVLALYQEAAARRWVIPCFCAENLTTLEAVLAAVAAHGERLGTPDLPVSTDTRPFSAALSSSNPRPVTMLVTMTV